jgi:signal transduction histidine kinase/ActR/RegA family two-component response regulator
MASGTSKRRAGAVAAAGTRCEHGDAVRLDLSPSAPPQRRLVSIPLVLVAVGASTLLRAWLVWRFALEDRGLDSLYFPAIFGCALFGGVLPGTLAVLLSVLAVHFTPPARAFGAADLVFVATGLLIAVTTDFLQRGRRRAESDKADLARSRAELTAAHRQRTEILESIRDAFLAVDAGWRLVYMNGAAEAAYGGPRERVIGTILWQAFPDLVGTPLESAMRRAAAHGVPLELDWEGPSGRCWEVRVHPHSGGTSVYMQDVSMRRAAERERNALLERESRALAEAQASNTAKDRFLSAVSHELRTPLQAIAGWVQILGEPNTTPEDREHGLRVIERNVQAQTKLIEDMLDMVRIASGKLRVDRRAVRPVELIDAAVLAARPAAAAKGIRIRTALDPSADAVLADPERIQQVLGNLLSNALKFTPPDGTISVGLARSGSFLEIRVSDTGDGIDPSFLPQVFEPFQQSSAGGPGAGLGLGLAIARSLVELHGGTLRAESEGIGKGATFTMRLALAPALPHAAASEGDDHQPLPSLDGVRVLLVEDDPDVCELFRRMLEVHGAQVQSVRSGAEALEALEHVELDVLVSDVGLPDRDGYSFLRELRVREQVRGRTGIPAIALTALARPEDRRRALLSGFQMHLSKPVDLGELVAAVAAMTGRS